jgi:beta-lactamase superfamily II metal-dependent hydrolase
MAFEIDFLPVGEGEKSGDAVAMRFGNLIANPPQQTVVVIDGGTKKSGAALVEHINAYYKTNSVQHVICTHSDADHASGLTEVLEVCEVHNLHMHRPWDHLVDVDSLLKYADTSTNTLKRHFKKSLDSAHELESIAKKKGIEVSELFSDNAAAADTFCVLGPSVAFYESLLESFRCADELRVKEGVFDKVFGTAEKAIRWLVESWSKETLVEPDDDVCSAENNSSMILLFTDGTDKFLFTSDAGVLALTEAANRANSLGFDLKSLNAFQVPHHGSKHNVGPSILDRIVGPKLNQETFTKTAVVSASKEAEPKHPSRRVVNALMRRGAQVLTTQGNTLWLRGGDVPNRGWGPAIPLQFNQQVEE